VVVPQKKRSAIANAKTIGQGFKKGRNKGGLGPQKETTGSPKRNNTPLTRIAPKDTPTYTGREEKGESSACNSQNEKQSSGGGQSKVPKQLNGLISFEEGKGRETIPGRLRRTRR